MDPNGKWLFLEVYVLKSTDLSLFFSRPRDRKKLIFQLLGQLQSWDLEHTDKKKRGRHREESASIRCINNIGCGSTKMNTVPSYLFLLQRTNRRGGRYVECHTSSSRGSYGGLGSPWGILTPSLDDDEMAIGSDTCALRSCECVCASSPPGRTYGGGEKCCMDECIRLERSSCVGGLDGSIDRLADRRLLFWLLMLLLYSAQVCCSAVAPPSHSVAWNVPVDPEA
jgi:hypothetical protein